MATPTQRDRLRSDLGLTITELSDTQADIYFAWAEADYPSNPNASNAAARVIVIDSLLAQAAKRNDYKQNQSEEKASQIFDHLKDLRQIYLDDIENATSGNAPVVLFGGLTRYTTRITDYPERYSYWTCGDVSRGTAW